MDRLLNAILAFLCAILLAMILAVIGYDAGMSADEMRADGT
jgi:hypothetical protein